MSGRGVIDASMRTYYEQRAAEYDDWWLGRGVFARRERPGWDDEVAAVLDAVRALAPARVLDVACGDRVRHTPPARRRHRPRPERDDGGDRRVAAPARAAVVRGDAVPLPFADGAFDRVFTGSFYGHLLEGERARFLAEARRVAPELVVLDAALREGGVPEEWQERKLNDGSRHQVYKRFFTPDGLASELGGGRVLHAGDWFVMVAAPR